MTNTYCPKTELDQFIETLSNAGDVTLVGLSDFGYAYVTPISVKEVTRCSYAQYDEAVKVTFRQKRKRSDSYDYYYASHSFSKLPAIIKGHPSLKAEIQFNEPKQVAGGIAAVSQAKYRSSDPRNVTDILDGVRDAVIFKPSRF